MTALTVTTETSKQVARPLRVLVPLIKEDLANAKEAADVASEPYFRAAGEKLLEAKSQMVRGEFGVWRKRNFKELSERDTQRCMSLVRSTPNIENRRNGAFNLREAIGEPRGGQPPAWREPVKENIERAKREAERVRNEQLSRAQERDEVRKLALRIVDIGWKVLQKEFRAKGVGKDAVQRLNRAREILKASA